MDVPLAKRKGKKTKGWLVFRIPLCFTFSWKGHHLMNRIITRHWFIHGIQQLKWQSAIWFGSVYCKQDALKVMHVVLSGTRTLSFCFLFPTYPTVNAQYKLVIQDKLRPYIWKTCSGPLGKSGILHHDNASVHTVKAMTGLFQSFNWKYWTTIGHGCLPALV